MARKTPNQLYWDAVKKRHLQDEFQQYLAAEGGTTSPERAQLFAMRKRNDGFTDMSERDLILMLAGKLPYMYD